MVGSVATSTKPVRKVPGERAERAERRQRADDRARPGQARQPGLDHGGGNHREGEHRGQGRDGDQDDRGHRPGREGGAEEVNDRAYGQHEQAAGEQGGGDDPARRDPVGEDPTGAGARRDAQQSHPDGRGVGLERQTDVRSDEPGGQRLDHEDRGARGDDQHPGQQRAQGGGDHAGQSPVPCRGGRPRTGGRTSCGVHCGSLPPRPESAVDHRSGRRALDARGAYGPRRPASRRAQVRCRSPARHVRVRPCDTWQVRS